MMEIKKKERKRGKRNEERKKVWKKGNIMDRKKDRKN